MNLKFLADADSVTLQLENAKSALEHAKSNFEQAKKAYDEMLTLAEDEGFPKAKLKKLVEDRIQSLRDSGMLEASKVTAKEAKPKKPKAKTIKEDDSSEEDFNSEINDDSSEEYAVVN